MRDRRIVIGLVLLAIVVGAIALRVLPLLTPNLSVGSVEYDAGVYYLAASLALDGAAPYRDVVLLHPPGIVLLLEPFAALGRVIGDRDAFLAARLLVVVVATLDLLLVARLASRWRGPVAGLTAAFVYATSVPVLLSESTLLLEPFLTLSALSAILLVAPPTPRPVSRGAAIAAGVVLAAGLAIKLWMVVPIALIGLRLLGRRDVRGLGWLGVAGVTTSVVLWGPSFLVDPGALIRDVFRVQAARPADGVAGVTDRLLALADFGPFGAQFLIGTASGWIGLVVAAAVVTWAVVRGGGEGRWWSALLIATIAFFLVSPSYYLHYAAFTTPALAILAGACVTAAVTWIRARGRRPVTVAVMGVLAVALVVTMARAGRQQLKVVGPGDDYGSEIAARVPDDACIAADVPTWLLLADRPPDPARGDEPMADLFGTQHVAALAADPDRFATSSELLRSPASEEVLDAYLRSCPFVVVAESQSTWPTGSVALLEQEYRLVADWSADGGPRLWQRR